MKKVKIIILYFGKFPNYYSLWEHSARKNSNYEFLIFNDRYGSEHSSHNVKYIKTSFAKIQHKFYEVLGNGIVLDSPYKLNDYRPTFGQVFAQEIGNADFWGFADIDVILGNLSRYISGSDFEYYDKIGNRGHLQLFANTKEMNELYLKKNRFGFDFKFVSSHSGAFHFDEMWGINGIALTQKVKVKEIENIADVSTKKFLFDNSLSTFYFYKGGDLFKQGNAKILESVSYIHLQKRSMRVCFKNNVDRNDNFKILPDRFISYSADISSMRVEKDWPDGYYRHLIKYYLSSFKKGELTARIPLLLIKIRHHV